MKDIRIRCKGCAHTYTLGKDAAIVTASGIITDWPGPVTVLGDGSSFANTRAAPDLVAPLEGGWGSLDPSAARQQQAEIARVSSSLSRRGQRWWRCRECGTVQTYRLWQPPSKQFQGRTLDEARAAAMAEVPNETIAALDVTRDVRKRTVKGEGKSAVAAIEAAKARAPSGAFDITPGEIIEEPQYGTVEVQAYSEEEAREVWKTSAAQGASLEQIECDLAPTKGFLGIGGKPGSWKVHWSTPFRAKVSFKMPAVVTVTLKE